MKIALFIFLGLALICQAAHGAAVWMTQYDQQFSFECDKNHHLTTILSKHIETKGDRVFNFSCEAAPGRTELENCEWSGELRLISLVQRNVIIF